MDEALGEMEPSLPKAFTSLGPWTRDDDSRATWLAPLEVGVFIARKVWKELSRCISFSLLVVMLVVFRFAEVRCIPLVWPLWFGDGHFVSSICKLF